MVDLESPTRNPNYLPRPSFPPPPPPLSPPSTSSPSPAFSFPKRPALRVTSEFDSNGFIFLHKISCKVFDNLAKLKLSFQNNDSREISQPQLSLTSKHLSIHCDLVHRNALVKSSVDIGPRFQFNAAHDVKSQQGEVAMVANLGRPGYALELSSLVPSVGYPKAMFKFPFGKVSLDQQKEEEEEAEKSIFSINGIVKGQIWDGIYSVHYTKEDLRIRYSYKDNAMSFIPSIALPSNALSFAFKRRFTPSDKLSYWYNFDSKYWSAVYKHKCGEQYKFKAGYDSKVCLGWASLWFGDEFGTAKAAPMKMKVQIMLQVPQGDFKSSAIMFRVKKRWDI